MQILYYVLARTLQSLGGVGKALEFYRWLRREDGQFRDVTERITTLSATRTRPQQASNTGGTILTQPASQVLQNLLRSTK